MQRDLLDHLRQQLAARKPGAEHPAHLRERVLDAVERGGLSIREACRLLRVGHQTLARWRARRDARHAAEADARHAAAASGPVQCRRLPPADVRAAYLRDLADRLRERDERLARFPVGDPNVVLLGDPPPGRRALDREQGRAA
jgi:transposase-like protein